MIRLLIKYGAVIFIINTILLSIEQTYDIGNQLFFILMSLFAIFLFFNPTQIKTIIFHKAFLFLLLLNGINILYFVFFHKISDFEAVKYLCARGIQFSILSFSVYYNYKYYQDKFLIHLSYIISIFLIIGFFIYPDIFSERYSGIFWNPNAFASFSIIAFAILFLDNKQKNSYKILLMFIALLFSLASGSRGVLLAVFLIFLIKYGFSFRNIIYGCVGIGIYFIFSGLEYETSLNRFAIQDLLNDRVLQYKYAILSIQNELFTGYGLDKYSYIDKKLVPLNLRSQLIGAHNGYLAILTQYGVFIGTAILYIIIRKSIILLFTFYDKSENYRIYIFIIIYTLFAATYESLIVGINEFQTLLFWFSLTLLSFNLFSDSTNES